MNINAQKSTTEYHGVDWTSNMSALLRLTQKNLTGNCFHFQ